MRGRGCVEELVNRHGPMVLRVCRGVLQDSHDAEDAFQAAFLVLAHHAGSVRRRNSVASWLFGVSHRVAAYAKRRAARLRAGEQEAASRRMEHYESPEDPEQFEVLLDELTRLPDHLRTAIALCYLEGMSCRDAAVRLGVSEGVLRGRLARARERLRQQLVRRGAQFPPALVFAGEAGQVPITSVPTSLIRSTLGIASGIVTGNTAAMLARGVIRSIFSSG